MRHQIPSKTTNGSWGFAHPHTSVKWPENTNLMLGAILDFSISALAAIEAQLNWNLLFGTPQEVRSLLYLYFALDEGLDPKPAQKRLIEVFGQTRQGLMREKGKLEIFQNDPSAPSTLAGYVEVNMLTGSRGHIHLQFSKISGPELALGAPIHCNLLVHEATHRYAKTIDAPVKIPSTSSKLAYFNIWKQNVLTTYAAASDKRKARELIAGTLTSHLAHADALNNADSYAWFMTAMIESYATTLAGVFQLYPKMKAELLEATVHYASVEENALKAIGHSFLFNPFTLV
ncbi:MAG: hypothetical protein ABW123_10490 [Cystobacter sp.]